jgi:TRAP-type mannitol/chloroaromatic compound transport system permease small subunit
MSRFFEIALPIAAVIDTMTRAAGKLATVLLLALIALVGWNVVGRYIIGGSSVALQELEWHLLAPVALLGITLLVLEKGHVRVDMVYDKLPGRAQTWLDLVSMLCGVVMALLFIKYSMGFVESSWSLGEGSADPGGLPARYLLKAMIPIGFALFALQCLASAIRHAAVLAGRSSAS